jgi:GH25 family lysozyme M1 (1,4-beta-N-acetylmuramidase)
VKTINIIDVSDHQKSIDFEKVKASGLVDAVMMRSTEGGSYIDWHFSGNRDVCRMFNIPRGFYHTGRPDLNINTPEGEAAFFLNVVGELHKYEVLALDLEPDYIKGVTNLVDWSKRFLDYVYKQTKVRPMLYMGRSTCRGYTWTSVVDADYGLWISTLEGNPAFPEIPYWQLTAMHQYSDKGVIPGITANTVDLNIFNGDLEQFKKYGYNYQPPVAATPVYLPEIIPAEVTKPTSLPEEVKPIPIPDPEPLPDLPTTTPINPPDPLIISPNSMDKLTALAVSLATGDFTSRKFLITAIVLGFVGHLIETNKIALAPVMAIIVGVFVLVVLAIYFFANVVEQAVKKTPEKKAAV